MTRAKESSSNVPTIGERAQRFCHYGAEPLLEVRSAARPAEVRDQAYMLIQVIEEVLGTAIGMGASGDDDAVMNTSTAYILRFAADAAAAMVGSLEVKQ